MCINISLLTMSYNQFGDRLEARCEEPLTFSKEKLTFNDTNKNVTSDVEKI
jgi:hypothetical protein